MSLASLTPPLSALRWAGIEVRGVHRDARRPSRRVRYVAEHIVVSIGSLLSQREEGLVRGALESGDAASWIAQRGTQSSRDLGQTLTSVGVGIDTLTR